MFSTVNLWLTFGNVNRNLDRLYSLWLDTWLASGRNALRREATASLFFYLLFLPQLILLTASTA
jgi:hypothetical protein